MRRWIIAVTTTLTLVAIIVVSRAAWTTPDAESRAARTPEIAAARALLRARNDSLYAWSLAQQRAYVLAAAATLRPSSAAFALETRGSVSARTRAQYTAIFEEELQDLPPTRVPIRVLLIADSSLRSEYFAPWYIRPQREGEACVIALRVQERPSPTARPRHGPQSLGPCGLYALAGLPGPSIARWLDATRARSALSYRAPSVPHPPRRRFEYAGSQMLPVLSPMACAAGRDAVCASALLEPDADRRQLPRVGPESGDALVQAYAFEVDDFPGLVTAAIRQALGDERFAQWWASELPPAEAFERIADRRFAAFAQDVVRPYFGRTSSGPLRAGLPLALGVLLAAALAYWAVTGTPRSRT